MTPCKFVKLLIKGHQISSNLHPAEKKTVLYFCMLHFYHLDEQKEELVVKDVSCNFLLK